MKLSTGGRGLVLVSALTLFSCKQKEETVLTVKETVQEIVEAPKVEASSELSADERGKLLGGVKYLSKETEGVFALYNAKSALESFFKSPTGEAILAASGEDDLMADLAEDPQGQVILETLGSEIVLAFGKGTSVQSDLLIDVFSVYSEMEAKMLVNTIESGLKDDGELPMQNYQQMFISMGQKLAKKINTAEMPPLTLMLKIPNKDKREMIRDLVTGRLKSELSMNDGGNAVVEVVEKEKSGVSFQGIHISGKELIAAQGAGLSMMLGMQLGEEATQSIVKSLSNNSLTVLVGEKDDYLIFYLGKTDEGLVLSETPASSIVADDGFKFVDAYSDKPFISVVYANEALVKSMNKVEKFQRSRLDGMLAGLKESKSFGETEDFEVLLQDVYKNFVSLTKADRLDALGTLVFVDEGLRIESHGGPYSVQMDKMYSHRFHELSAHDDIAIYMSSALDEETRGKWRGLMSDYADLAYLGATKFAALNTDASKMPEFRKGLKIYNTAFKKDAGEIWKALDEKLAAGLGDDRALVIDFQGELPAYGDLPEDFNKGGFAPRIVSFATVTDRQKLAEAWSEIDKPLQNIFTKAGEMAEAKLPKMRPLSSEKDSLKSYFYPIPGQTDDFTPSISISDEFFLISSSKSASENYLAGLKDADSIDRSGAYVKMEFKPVTEFAERWLDTALKNKDTFFKSDYSREDFIANEADLRNVIRIFETLDHIELQISGENGKARSSLHVKAK